MHLQQLSALLAVADNGSFSAAAEALGTVQSNVSAHVARLERELGSVLVDRGAGSLTEEGQVVAARARRVSEEIDAMLAELAGLRHEILGTARVGTIGTTARWLLPAVLSLARRRHPGLRLVAVEGTTQSLEPQLRSGQLDLAVLNLPVREAELVAVPLFEEDLVLVTSPEDPLARRRVVTIEDLARVPLLLPVPGNAFREEIESALRPAGISLTPKAEMDGVRLIASLTFEGEGPSILPASAVPGYLRPHWSLRRVRGLPPRRIGVARRRRAVPSAPARALMEMLREVVSGKVSGKASAKGDSRAVPEGIRPSPPGPPEPHDRA
jgi:DNA-binding transcriptional LysR family regulator